MPRYGLSSTQREAKPWGLDADLLAPGKVILDPLHGDIHVTRLEQEFIDSAPFQRLRRLKQLGNAHLVYPGATHTRFSHSLGALKVAQTMLDSLVEQRLGLSAVPDLFSQWAHTDSYDRNVAEVTVLARLGALLHDLCHIPFGHTLEDDLGVLVSHDANELRLDRYLSRMPTDLLGADLEHHLRPLIVSKALRDPKEDPDYRYPFVMDLVGNTICADLLDYLARDHAFSGMPMELGTRFVDYFYVTPAKANDRGSIVLRVSRRGQPREDILGEVLKYLRYRYEETQRILFHKTKLAADVMLGRLVEEWYRIMWYESAAAILGKVRIMPFLRTQDEHAVPLRRTREEIIERVGEEFAVPESSISVSGSAFGPTVDAETAHALEQRLSELGDDGTLERLRESEGDLRAHRSVRSLAQGLLDRTLFARIGACSFRNKKDEDLDEVRKRFVDEYGDREARRDLEDQVSNFLERPGEPAVLLWLPRTGMHLKPADVMIDIDNGGKPFEFKYYKNPRGVKEGDSIVDQHKDLWSLQVFMNESLFPSDEIEDVRRSVLAWLAHLLSETVPIVWDGADPQPSMDVVLTDGVSHELGGVTTKDWETIRGIAREELSALSPWRQVDNPSATPTLSSLQVAVRLKWELRLDDQGTLL